MTWNGLLSNYSKEHEPIGVIYIAMTLINMRSSTKRVLHRVHALHHTTRINNVHVFGLVSVESYPCIAGSRTCVKHVRIYLLIVRRTVSCLQSWEVIIRHLATFLLKIREHFHIQTVIEQLLRYSVD